MPVANHVKGIAKACDQLQVHMVQIVHIDCAYCAFDCADCALMRNTVH
jgi:hypothetical protein